jgi:O-antigen/teichoic acid export membrane protein
MKRLLKKYNELPQAVKASLWFAICNALQKGISLLSTPIFTRLLTTEQYGVYTVYQSWYNVISIFATLNLYFGVVNNGMTKYPQDRKRFISSIQGLCTTITCVVFVVYIIGMNFWNNVFQLSTLFMLLMFLELLFAPAYNFWAATQRYDYRYRALVIVTIIMALASPVLGIIIVLQTKYKAEARVFSFVLVQVCIGMFFYIYNLSKGKTFFFKEYWKFALKFNIPLLPHYLSATILNQADRLMINSMVGKGEAAIYSIAYNVATMMTIITTAINNSFTPYMYKSIQKKEFSGIRSNSKYILAMVGLACIFVMALGPEIISIFATKEYYSAIYVIPPVACAVFFQFLYPLFSTVEFYYEKTTFVMIASCIGAVLNIILNYFFIPIYGFYAAGYTTLFCYFLYSLSHYIMHRIILKKENIKEKLFDEKFIVCLCVIMAVIMIFMTAIYSYALARYLICLVILMVLICNYKKIIYILKNK